MTSILTAADPPKTLHSFSVNGIDGKLKGLDEYRGKVVLVVNVASKCGFTPQYAGLEALYRAHRDKGLVILGFPANDFLWQEPGSNEEIATFCRRNYDVTFPMFAKLSVRGGSQHALYRWLTSEQGRVSWNFNKFLVGKDGRVIAKFGSTVKPEAPEFTGAIAKALAHQ
ncbi:MAG: glutathione peroxidase [Acidobacteria bacterium]|nr:glutathione peroxidase [Acidobacteriota bacterium]